MHLVHVTPYMERGGTERCILNLAHQATTRGWKVSLVSPPGSGLEQVPASVPVLELDCWGFSCLRRSLGSLRERLSALGSSVDVVHVHAAAEMAFYVKKYRPDIPVVFTCHGYDNILPSYCNYWWAAQFLKRVERTVALNPVDRDYFLAAGLDRQQVVFIRNGVEEAFFVDKVNGRNRPEPRPVGIVGRLVQQKNIAWAIEALAEHGFTDKLLVVGEGPLRERLETLARRRRVPAKVHFLGYRDDMEVVYSTFAALLVCSRNEAGQLAILEALAAGVPVLVPAWLPGTVKLWNNTCGVIVYENGGDLREKLERVVPKIDREAVQETARRFVWSRTFESYARVYQMVRQGAGEEQ